MPKKIAVASGKGGTGKTTVTILLALLLSGRYKVQVLDCDVENPDCHLFLKGMEFGRKKVGVFFPVVDIESCTLCGECQRVCRFNCLLVTGTQVMFFPELCHPCEGCLVACPESAISGGIRRVGEKLSIAAGGNLFLNYAVMDVGEARANPLIHSLKQEVMSEADFVIYDSPPGANCPVVEAVRDADYVILVAEPTPFGLYDLSLAWRLVDKLGIPAGIVINRSEGRDGNVDDFASGTGAEIIFRLPFSIEFARRYSEGQIGSDFAAGLDDAVLSALRASGEKK